MLSGSLGRREQGCQSQTAQAWCLGLALSSWEACHSAPRLSPLPPLLPLPASPGLGHWGRVFPHEFCPLTSPGPDTGPRIPSRKAMPAAPSSPSLSPRPVLTGSSRGARTWPPHQRWWAETSFPHPARRAPHSARREEGQWVLWEGRPSPSFSIPGAGQRGHHVTSPASSSPFPGRTPPCRGAGPAPHPGWGGSTRVRGCCRALWGLKFEVLAVSGSQQTPKQVWPLLL